MMTGSQARKPLQNLNCHVFIYCLEQEVDIEIGGIEMVQVESAARPGKEPKRVKFTYLGRE